VHLTLKYDSTVRYWDWD